ncbi:hypothetical protein [Actinokineospora enzanensis]|uniref:hypothetical protein n=1 Tax=Actinokineospora enzanensis TaxID=155975 RepID=UPI0005276C8B|nr:hypothetical protein [Actinokineospora enzanensis]
MVNTANTATTDSALLAAGAVLPGAQAPGDDRDTLVARHYTHPALDDRVVVRLVPAVLGEAEDLSCEYLGFAAPARVEPVGTARREALGFPAWALINDPANGHHALALVKEIERLDRVAKSRAGAAKDGFTELAALLGRAAPHFLPTFYEEAGRVFLRHGNTAYAATMFGKAREAEAAHRLTVDPERVRAVFLEFAFAGALSAKALSAHARELTRRYPAEQAYEQFRTLCVERVRGGLPPHAGMPEDLRRMAKAAKRDAAAEDELVLRAVLDAAPIGRAAAGFWKSYRDAVVGLATRDDAVRARLLEFVPQQTTALPTWLEILAACGATADLTGPARPGASTTPAGWLSAVVATRTAGWRDVPRSPELLALAASMIDRLVADGLPVDIAGRWRESELDLADLLVAGGVPLARPESWPLHVDIDDWFGDSTPGRRDLVALAASERGEPLGEGVVGYLYSRSGRSNIARVESVREVLEVPGLRSALRDWITEHATGFGRTIAEVADKVREMATLRVAEAFTDAPEAAAAVAGVDIAAALRRTLRAGLMDELGWPALEEAASRFPAAAAQSFGLRGEGWPALVLGVDQSFVVAGPDGVLAEHVARVADDQRHKWNTHTVAHWFDGALLVCWSGPSGRLGYWSDDAQRPFAPGGTDAWVLPDTAAASIPLPDGGRFTGGRAVHRGDTRVPFPRTTHGDGVTLWSAEYQETGGPGKWVWHQVDPVTGAKGRTALPAFLDEFAAAGTTLDLVHSHLRPAAPGTGDSPLGTAHGLHGWRLRQEADGGWTGEGVDGRGVRAAVPVAGLLDLPGSRLTVALHGTTVTLLDPDGAPVGSTTFGARHPDFAAGTPLVVPMDWWHLLRPRDEAGSAALRAVTTEAAEAMLAAAVAARPATEGAFDWDAEGEDSDANRDRHAAVVRGDHDPVVAAVRAALPEVSHPALLAGVAAVVRRAASVRAACAEFAEIAATVGQLPAAPATATPGVTEGEITAALDWFGGHRRSDIGPAQTTLPTLITALREIVAEDGDAPQSLPEGVCSAWVDTLPHIGAVALRAASPITAEAERAALVRVLRWTADSGILDDPGHWRRVTVQPPKDQAVHRYRTIPVRDGFIAVISTSWYGAGASATGLQFTRTPGTFALPEGWSLVGEEDIPATTGAAWITRFLDVLAERGPAGWRQEAAADLVRRTGLGTAEAAYLLGGLPGVDRWGASFISTGDRAALGLSIPGAKAAKERMRGLSEPLRLRLLAAAVPAEPERLWTDGPDVAAVAEVWTARFGMLTPVDDDVLVDAAKRLPLRRTTEYVTGVLNPKAARWLTTDARMRIEERDLVEREKDGFGESDLYAVPRVLLWLAQRLPAGSPHRAALPEALAAARQRVAHPDFCLSIGGYLDDEEAIPLLGIQPLTEPGVVRVRDWLDATYDGHHYSLFVWPGRVGPHDRDLLVAAMEITGSANILDALDLLAADGLTAACAVPPLPEVDPAAYFQDPTLSVPHLVAEVAAHHRLDQDAAALYLQLLALPDPTDANVARWTGWKPARLRAARAALAETELVLSAKRARAGRSLFLPGEWLALANPYLPLEAWKTRMYGFTDHPWIVIAPHEPVADLFTRAWKRVLAGDAPAYERLETGRRR